MAKVIISIKVYPANAEVNLDALKRRIKEEIPEYASIHRFDEEPIAFGLTALIVHIILPEERAGGVDEVERALKGTEGVGEIETVMVRRAP